MFAARSVATWDNWQYKAGQLFQRNPVLVHNRDDDEYITHYVLILVSQTRHLENSNMI